MKRIAVNIDPAIGAILENQARLEKRSVSSLICIIIERKLREDGVLQDGTHNADEVLALAHQVGIPTAIDTLRRRLRAMKPADAA